MRGSVLTLRQLLAFACAWLGVFASCAVAGDAALKETFPRLLGMNITDKSYENPGYAKELSQLDAVILGFYRGWNQFPSGSPIRDAVQAIKLMNPNILIGQYTVLNEAYPDKARWVAERDKAAKISHEDWWLRQADGRMVQWTDQYDSWEVNITGWSKTDAEGQRYPQWLARRDYDLYFKPVSEFDIWYFDNVSSLPLVRSADWNRDGSDDSGLDTRIAAAVRQGHADEWRAARLLVPNVLLMANVSSRTDLSEPEYRGQLGGAFLEGMMGPTWSLESTRGWPAMMQHYRSALRNTAWPHLVAFHVSGGPDDFKRFRYAFASCLLDDGYFSYSDAGRGYSGVIWFDEYDAKLGRAVSPPALEPWRDGVYRRDFEYGVVLVNPSLSSRTVDVGSGFHRIKGKQDSRMNTGLPASRVTLLPKDGIVLMRDARLSEFRVL